MGLTLFNVWMYFQNKAIKVLPIICVFGDEENLKTFKICDSSMPMKFPSVDITKSNFYVKDKGKRMYLEPHNSR